MNDRTYVVVGVLPQDMPASDLYIPMPRGVEERADSGFGRPVVRLKAGVTPRQIRVQLGEIAAPLAHIHFVAGYLPVSTPRRSRRNMSTTALGAAACNRSE